MDKGAAGSAIGAALGVAGVAAAGLTGLGALVAGAAVGSIAGHGLGESLLRYSPISNNYYK